MTIDEAIAKYKEITNTDANCPAHCNISCDKCVDESKQLAEWLEELKKYKQNAPSDVVASLKRENEVLKNRCKVLSNGVLCLFCNFECERRPQLKAGENNGNL